MLKIYIGAILLQEAIIVYNIYIYRDVQYIYILYMYAHLCTYLSKEVENYSSKKRGRKCKNSSKVF